MTRFLIIGQERSGTTYIQTLLASHPDIHCRGEMFDPWQIDDDGQKNTDQSAVRARDADPAEFLERMLRSEGLRAPCPSILGIKVLVHHNPRLFSGIIPSHPDIRVIHVRRANKLAQFASRQQVQLSGQWTSQSASAEQPLIQPAPNWATAECNRLENEDFLLSAWLGSLKNPVMTISYSEMFRDDTAHKLCAHLGARRSKSMASPLRKQGQDTIAARFKNAEAISEHFRAIGRGDWVGPELSV